MPILLLAKIGFVLQFIAEAISNALGTRLKILQFIGLLIAAALTVVSSLFVAGLVVAQSLSNAVGHGSEFQADRRVVQMGFGRELLTALRNVETDSYISDEASKHSLLVSSHPPAEERIKRLESLMRIEDPFR